MHLHSGVLYVPEGERRPESPGEGAGVCAAVIFKRQILPLFFGRLGERSGRPSSGAVFGVCDKFGYADSTYPSIDSLNSNALD